MYGAGWIGSTAAKARDLMKRGMRWTDEHAADTMSGARQYAGEVADAYRGAGGDVPALGPEERTIGAKTWRDIGLAGLGGVGTMFGINMAMDDADELHAMYREAVDSGEFRGSFAEFEQALADGRFE